MQSVSWLLLPGAILLIVSTTQLPTSNNTSSPLPSQTLYWTVNSWVEGVVYIRALVSSLNSPKYRSLCLLDERQCCWRGNLSTLFKSCDLVRTAHRERPTSILVLFPCEEFVSSYLCWQATFITSSPPPLLQHRETPWIRGWSNAKSNLAVIESMHEAFGFIVSPAVISATSPDTFCHRTRILVRWIYADNIAHHRYISVDMLSNMCWYEIYTCF